MKDFITVVVLALLLAALPAAALAQGADESLTLTLHKDWGYGPGSRIQGTYTMQVAGPEDLVRVEFLIDGQVVGADEEAPFSLQFETGDFETGAHRLRAAGLTADGRELRSNEYQVEFISGEEALNTVKDILLPLLGVVVAFTLIGTLGPLLLGRRERSRPIGTYGAAGGAVCPKCGLPFSRQVLSLNLLVGKLERCPHCGRWSLVRRAAPAQLQAAEARLRQDLAQGEMKAEESEQERLRRLAERSRFEE